MKKFFILILLLAVTGANAETVAIKRPEVKNLPRGYSPVIFSFFEEHFKNVVKYPTEKDYTYLIQPVVSWIATSYNVCLNVYKKGKLVDIHCSVSFSAEDLHDDLEKLSISTGILEKKKDQKTKYIYIKLIGKGNLKGDRLKIVSSKGDILVDYKNLIEKADGDFITVSNAVINIDTAYIQSFEAAKLLEYLLNNYKVKGILIIKIY
ncbi:MAG TPA: hypothetical protein DEP48_08730 [Persephonella sp.]|uniref:Uncharacterized protein n=1 Tax=Persephonella marina (strain DSM 14350 / EX-H1) TaxID=123214 RepID=C0QTD9_PERMH|nr:MULTISPECIES: hypothetical protein [Persephonella]ACO04819.1 hypothetical protein PERMA_0156 [Persephonella marina EX-H1]HCB70427.1 hypothetical protein [Persephonella sp.]